MEQTAITITDNTIIQAKTDSVALGGLYEHYYERLLRFCVLRLFDQDAAEEVMGSIFLSVADGIGRFRGSTERQFGSWLYKIAVNQCNNVIRKSKRRQRILERVSHELVERGQRPESETSETMDNWPAVYEALSKLKPIEQTVITLRFFEKLDYETISEITGKRTSSVRVIQHRALNKLRDRLSHLIGG